MKMKNMALDLDQDFIAPFQVRPFTDNYHYVGVGKVIDAGSLFSAYTDDPKVVERTSHLIDGIIKTRDADGYIGTFKPEPEGRFRKKRHLHYGCESPGGAITPRSK